MISQPIGNCGVCVHLSKPLALSSTRLVNVGFKTDVLGLSVNLFIVSIYIYSLESLVSIILQYSKHLQHTPAHRLQIKSDSGTDAMSSLSIVRSRSSCSGEFLRHTARAEDFVLYELF